MSECGWCRSVTDGAPQCWCRNCHADFVADNRIERVDLYAYYHMYLCPECGNKRCPRATNHELLCTGSNAPGQPGSAYGGWK